MKRKLIVITVAFCCLTMRSAIGQISSKDRIDIIYKNINTIFREKEGGLYFETTDTKHNENLHSWLWPLCAVIQATNEMEQLQPKVMYMTPVVKAIDQYYNDLPPSPGYQDYVRKERLSSRFYDDNQWIAIAYLDAYSRNKNVRYLNAAKMIYKFMMTGFDTVSGGGLYWKEKDFSTKNTCSNGPGILVALQLYKITRNTDYLNTALSLYSWTNKYLRSPEGVYYDAIKIPSLKLDKALYTYNTGTMLQANALLYQLTKDASYLKEAQTIARAGKNQFYKNNKLPNDYWFNAVMLRGYAELFKIDKNKEWIQFYIEDAERVWREERDSKDLLGTKEYKRLIDQAGMLEIYARLENLKKQIK